MYNKFLGMRNFEKDAERLLTELGSAPDAFVQGFGKILTIHHDDGGVEVFDVTSAGFTAALAAADAGDAVWLPPFASIGDAHTIPAGVGVQAYGKKSTLTGPITLNASSFLQSVYIVNSANSGSDVIGVISSPYGTAYIVDCSVIVENAGAGDIYGVKATSGELWIWESNIEGSASGAGDAYGLGIDGEAIVYAKDARLIGEAISGSGYGGFIITGELTADGGRANGTTARFGKA